MLDNANVERQIEAFVELRSPEVPALTTWTRTASDLVGLIAVFTIAIAADARLPRVIRSG